MNYESKIQLKCMGVVLSLQLLALLFKCFYSVAWLWVLLPLWMPLVLLGSFMVFWMIVGICEMWGVEDEDDSGRVG